MDRSSECKCPCHTKRADGQPGAIHIMACSCYSGNPVLDEVEETTKPEENK